MRTLLLVSLVLSLAGSAAHAEFMMPELAPLDRMVKNAEAYLAKNPAEAGAHYTLARLHYLAFASQSDHVPVFRSPPNGKVNVPPDALIGKGRPVPAEAKTLTEDERLAQAMAAERSFREAIARDPENGLYHLGLASLLDAVRKWLAAAQPVRVPPAWAPLKVATVRATFDQAFAVGMIKDVSIERIPTAGLTTITSYEAANALVRLAAEDPASLTDADRRRLDDVKAALAKFGDLKRGAITPIVFSMQPTRHLAEMLAPETTVDFDLRGYGPAERWPWVKPELGFLVWDPLATGRIDSARQLFGGYSFQIFRKDGYDALAALDDNGDGQLAGEELASIRVWFDRNSDGVSTASEVVSLEDLGISAIATTAPLKDGVHPMNPNGVTVRGGRTLPTWDWIVEPLAR